MSSTNRELAVAALEAASRVHAGAGKTNAVFVIQTADRFLEWLDEKS